MFLPLHDSARLRVIRYQVVTLTLVLVNVAIFLWTHYGLPGQEAQALTLSLGAIPAVLSHHAVLDPALVTVPEFLTLVTYMFLHGGWLHLIGNMAFLWVFADNVEDGFGHVGFFAFYVACGIAGALVHTVMMPHSQLPMIGASGAVAGVLASYMILFPKSRVWVLLFMRIPLRISAAWALGGWIGFQILSAFIDSNASQSIAWWGHIGGFAAGFLLTLLFRPWLTTRLSRGAETEQ